MSDFSIITKQEVNFRVHGWPITEQRQVPEVFLGISYWPLSTDYTLSPNEARRLAHILILAADEADGQEERITREEVIYSLLAASGPQDYDQIKLELQTQLGDYNDPRKSLDSMAAHGLILKSKELDTWEAIE